MALGPNEKFPDYMYSKGNLFGKALSADLVAANQSAKASGRSSGKVSTGKAMPMAQSNLMLFLIHQMGIAQATRWMKRVQAGLRRPVDTDEVADWRRIERFVHRELTPAQARRYLRVLQSRKARNEPLIRGVLS